MHNPRVKRPLKDIAAIALPGVYLAIVLCIDAVIPASLITPFFVVLGFLVMAVSYRPIVMIPWALGFTVVICSVFLSPKLFILFAGHPYFETYFMQIIRAGTYCMVCVVSIYLCVALNRLRKSEEELTHILKNIPWPILTSDANGRILYWNKPAGELLPELAKSQYQLNYFDLLAPPEFHGRTISEYIKRIDGEQVEEPLKLSVKGRPYKGHTQIIEWTENKVLLTILSEGDLSIPSFAL